MAAPFMDRLDGVDGPRRHVALPVVLELSQLEHRQLVRPFGALSLDRVALTIEVTISQSRMEIDRAAGLDLALAVENYVTRQKHVVTRHGGETGLVVRRYVEREDDEEEGNPALGATTFFRVFTEIWVPRSPMRPGEPVGVGSAITFTLPEWTTAVAPGPASASQQTEHP